MVLPPQETPNTRTRIGFFELPVALEVQALLLPCVQDQAGGIASVTINREPPVKVGANTQVAAAERRQMPMTPRKLSGGRVWDL